MINSRKMKGSHRDPAGNDVREAQPYVTHAELPRLAKRNGCAGVQVEPALALCRPVRNFWVFKATVYESAHCRGFVGYGA